MVYIQLLCGEDALLDVQECLALRPKYETGIIAKATLTPQLRLLVLVNPWVWGVESNYILPNRDEYWGVVIGER